MTRPESASWSPAHRRSLRWALAVVWASFFTLTHVPIAPVLRSLSISLKDVVLHATGYAVLGAVLSLTLIAHGRRGLPLAALVAAVLAAYGAFDELTQPLVGRDAALDDWLADVLGAVVAGAIAGVLTRRQASATSAPGE